MINEYRCIQMKVLTTSEGNIYRRSHMTGCTPQSRDQSHQTKIAKTKSLKTPLQYILRNKKLGFLQQLLILDRLQQYITIDFKKYSKSKTKYNIVVIFVDRLGKQLIIVLVQDIITAKELIPLFLMYIVQYVGLLDLIISN